MIWSGGWSSGGVANGDAPGGDEAGDGERSGGAMAVEGSYDAEMENAIETDAGGSFAAGSAGGECGVPRRSSSSKARPATMVLDGNDSADSMHSHWWHYKHQQGGRRANGGTPSANGTDSADGGDGADSLGMEGFFSSDGGDSAIIGADDNVATVAAIVRTTPTKPVDALFDLVVRQCNGVDVARSGPLHVAPTGPTFCCT